MHVDLILYVLFISFYSFWRPEAGDGKPEKVTIDVKYQTKNVHNRQNEVRFILHLIYGMHIAFRKS